MIHPQQDEQAPPYIKFEDDCPEGIVAARVVGPSGKWSFRFECVASRWKDRHTLLLWELLQDVIADEEMEREVPNLSVVRAETHLLHAFSDARHEASTPAPSLARVRLAR